MQYMLEEFSMRRLINNEFEGETVETTVSGDGSSDQRKRSWLLYCSPSGSEPPAGDGGNWSQSVPAIAFPDLSCAGDPIYVKGHYYGRVAGFESASTFDGPVPDCIRIEVTLYPGRAETTTVWFAKGRGPVRAEYWNEGILIFAVAAYGAKPPIRSEVLELFDWHESVLPLERERAAATPEIRPTKRDR